MKKILSILLVTALVFRLSLPIATYAAPERPARPGDTEQPEPPSNSQPEPTPVPTAAPTASPTQAPTPTPVPTPATASTPVPATSSDPTPTPKPTTSAAQAVASPSPIGQQANDQIGVDEVTIDTGDAVANGTITNTGNNNSVEGPQISDDEGGAIGGISITNESNLEESDNSATANLEDTSTIIQDNDADLDNNLNVDLNTGNNEASRNLADTHINTGDAYATGTIANMVNTNAVGATIAEFNILDDQMGDYLLDFTANCVIGCGAGNIGITNQGNGADSNNNGTVNLSDTSSTFQNNDATVENNMILAANTGNNTSEDNLGDEHSINTGDATVAASVLNFLNNNFYGNITFGVVNIFGDLIGDIIVPQEYLDQLAIATGVNLENSGNGSGSSNSANYNGIENDTYNQNNVANIENNINIEAVTGENQIKDNLGGSHSIETGDTNVDVNLTNIANNNFIGNNWWLVIVNEAGNWVGKLIALPGSNVAGNVASSNGVGFSNDGTGNVDISNQGNGANSSNTGAVNYESENLVDQNNNAQIVNNIDLFANTGNNKIAKNLGDAEIVTGDANAMLNVVNFVNNNFIGSNVFVSIVNVFGSWVGDFITPGASKPAPVANSQNESSSGIGGVTTLPTNTYNQNSLSNSNSNSNSSSPESVTQNSVPFQNQYLSSSFNPVSNFSTTSEDDDDSSVLALTTADEVNDSQSSGKTKVRINLAWLLPIGLFAGTTVAVRRRLRA